MQEGSSPALGTVIGLQVAGEEVRVQFMDCSSGCIKKPRAGLYAGNAAPSLCNCLLFSFFFFFLCGQEIMI